MKKTEFIEKMPLNFSPIFHEGNQIYTPKNISLNIDFMKKLRFIQYITKKRRFWGNERYLVAWQDRHRIVFVVDHKA